VAGGTLAEALSAPLSDLLDRLADAGHSAFLNHDDGMGAPDVGSVPLEWPAVVIDTAGFFSSPPAQLEFNFAGEFEAMVTGSPGAARTEADWSTHRGRRPSPAASASALSGIRTTHTWE
jgi:hypothetical protein